MMLRLPKFYKVLDPAKFDLILESLLDAYS